MAKGRRSRPPRSGAFRPALAKNDPQDHFSGAPNPPGPQRAMEQAEETKLASASHLSNVKRAPGHKKSRRPAEKQIHLFFDLSCGFFLCACAQVGSKAACPGAVICVIGATAGSCWFDCPSSIRNWLLCSFLPREESASPSPQFQFDAGLLKRGLVKGFTLWMKPYLLRPSLWKKYPRLILTSLRPISLFV